MALRHVYLIGRDRSQYAFFKTLEETTDRQIRLRAWVVESIVFYGILPLGFLVAIGHARALRDFPEFLLPPSDGLRAAVSSDGGFLSSLLSGIAMSIVPALLLGPTAFTLAHVYRESKGDGNSRNAMLEVRDIEPLFPLFPRNRTESLWTAALSVSAGINEELSFRLVIPLMLYIVTGSTAMAVILPTIWFGFAHLDQGWFGVAATLVLGALFFFVYLLTQNIWLTMLVHAVLDLNHLAFAHWF